MKQQLSDRKEPLLGASGVYNGTISVIIPCRNERGTIAEAVERCPPLATEMEFIFVEGNSSDNTLTEIQRFSSETKQNVQWLVQDGCGKGDAVRKGFEHATGDILVILDGDLTVPPEELDKFILPLIQKKADFINGSRLKYPMELGAMGWLAWIANHGFGFIASIIMWQRVTDTLCGTKVLWKKDYLRIAANRNKLGLCDPFGDFDLLFGAAYLKLRIAEVPVHYKARTYGKTNISRFKEVWFLMWMCLRAFWVLWIRS